MGLSARQPEEHDSTALARRGMPTPNAPIILHAPKPDVTALKLVDAPEEPTAQEARSAKGKDGAVLRGLRDLQQLQKQTIAVLEAVRGNLEDIQQVLRSPEATRGMEKRQNAAALLVKGFARDAVVQAQGAVELLPANPDAHLLLSLSLAADQQFDGSLAAARKGLALFDRRQHPLAIEAGLLHAIAALGHGVEAAERWEQIIDALPRAVLLEHLGRIAVCYPGDAPEGQLDAIVERRIARQEDGTETPARRRRIVAEDVPAATLLQGLDAAAQHALRRTKAAILVYLKDRAASLTDITDAIRFLGEFVLPLGNRGMARPAASLAKRCGRCLITLHADAMTLYRAMLKFQMAGCDTAARDIAALLQHCGTIGTRQALARRLLGGAALLMLLGVALLIYVLWPLGAISGKQVVWAIGGLALPAIWVGPALLGLGALTGVVGLLGRFPAVKLPLGRAPLTREERAFLRTREVRQNLRSALH